jgi:hypothetical protein
MVVPHVPAVAARHRNHNRNSALTRRVLHHAGAWRDRMVQEIGHKLPKNYFNGQGFT